MNDYKYERKGVLLSGNGLSLILGEGEKRTLVLNNLDFEVRNIVRPGGGVTGQIIGLLAPSGIGKTQTLRMIAGLQEPTTGTILVGEHQVPTSRGLVGVVGQKYPLFRHRTVMSNLLRAAHLGGMKKKAAKDKALELLRHFGLVEHANKYPSELSGGQRQRIAIIQQMLCSEHLLLMDEPFSGLDYLAKKEACRLIQETASADERNTLLLVSHDIDTLGIICDTIWILGRDYENGQPKPGARIQEVIDLIEANLAWHEGIDQRPEFAAYVANVKQRFEAGL